MSSEPKASSSAVAQSIGPFRMLSALRSSWGRTFGCTENPSGKVRWALATASICSAVMAVPRSLPSFAG